MSEAPPALVSTPQFTPEYWHKVPRQTQSAEIMRVTNVDVDGVAWVEIAFKNGLAFKRKKSDIGQLLTANMKVHVEFLGNGELITGMLVPDVGWVFRMTAEDLAEYTRELSLAAHERRRAQKQQMIDHLAPFMVDALIRLGFEFTPDSGEEADARDVMARTAQYLASVAISALEAGPQE